jgi:murein L,D-transpeptidase YafK
MRNQPPPGSHRFTEEEENAMRSAVLLIALLFVHTPVWGKPHGLPSSLKARQAVERHRTPLVHQLTARQIQWGSPIFIRIFKSEKILEVWLKRTEGYVPFASYPICTYGGKGAGPKTRKGDGRAPEGFYFVTPRQMNPFSHYHLAFNLGYPNIYDRCHGRTGAALMVHGHCVSIGCFAMTDPAMEAIYTLADAALRNGQPFFRVHIFPFRMTSENMHRHRRSRWIDFWSNLKDGYDWFAAHHHTPPNVLSIKGRYRFESTCESPQ